GRAPAGRRVVLLGKVLCPSLGSWESRAPSAAPRPAPTRTQTPQGREPLQVGRGSAVHAVERFTWMARWNSGEKPGCRLGCLLPAGCSGDSTIAAPGQLVQALEGQEEVQTDGSGGRIGGTVTGPGSRRIRALAGDRRRQS